MRRLVCDTTCSTTDGTNLGKHNSPDLLIAQIPQSLSRIDCHIYYLSTKFFPCCCPCYLTRPTLITVVPVVQIIYPTRKILAVYSTWAELAHTGTSANSRRRLELGGTGSLVRTVCLCSVHSSCITSGDRMLASAVAVLYDNLTSSPYPCCPDPPQIDPPGPCRPHPLLRRRQSLRPRLPQ